MRSLFATAGCVLAVTALLLSSFPVTAAEDWTMFLRDLGHNAVTASSGPTKPMILWQNKLNPDGIYASASIHGGRLFIGSRDRRMVALDALTGDTVWSYQAGSAPNGHGIDTSAAIEGGKVYFGNDDFKFYCLNEESGAFLWSYTVANAAANPQTYGVQASPAITGSTVVTGADMTQADNLGLINNLVGLNTETGDKKWTFDTGGRVYSSPAIDGSRVYFATLSGGFYCLDMSGATPRRSPTVVWSKTLGHGMMSSPMLFGGKVFMGEGWYQDTTPPYPLHAYKPDGTEAWSFNSDGPIISTPIPYEGKLYFSDYDGNVYCLNGNGALVWRHRLSDKNIWATPLLADGKLYIGSLDKNLYCLDAAGKGDGTTSLLWNLTLDGEIWASCVLVDGRMYIGTLSGTMYCIVEDSPTYKNPEVDYADATPVDVEIGKDVTLKLSLKPGGSLKRVTEVYANLAVLGGTNRTALFDDGTGGDVLSGDGLYTLRYTVPKGSATGHQDIDITVLYSDGKSAIASVGFRVSPSSGGGGGGSSPGFEAPLIIMAAIVMLLAGRRERKMSGGNPRNRDD